MNKISRFAVYACVASLGLAPAFAQTAPTLPTMPKPTVSAPAINAPAASTSTAAKKTAMPAKASKEERTAKSMQCSKDADGKSMHGKARKKFMSECKKA